MAQITRTDLLNAHPSDIAAHLTAKGISSTIRDEGTSYVIDCEGQTAAQITTALFDFVASVPRAQWRPPLPGDLPAHAQHLVSFLAATPVQIAALTQAQKDHVLQDCVRALRWFLDDRLGT